MCWPEPTLAGRAEASVSATRVWKPEENQRRVLV